MANRLKTNPIYFDTFGTDTILAKRGQPFIVKKIRMLSVADGDDFVMKDLDGNIIYYLSNNIGGGDVKVDDFGNDGYDFGPNGVQILVADCNGMIATDGTDAIWFYTK